MKVYIPNYEPNRVGGGWSFQDNLVKGLGDNFVTSEDEADIYLIAGATTVQREEVQRAKDKGLKIVLRVDNALMHTRNRMTGMPRMEDYAEWSDLVIYQSNWGRNYLSPHLGAEGPVIINGCNLDLFKEKEGKENTYLYLRSSRADTKNWEMARYTFSRIHQKNPHAKLTIVGKFGSRNAEYNFDFYQGENYSFLGTQPHENLAKIYQDTQYFLYPYFNDACSNTLIEALASGCEVVGLYGMEETGGAPEILAKYSKFGREYFSIERMTAEYLTAFEEL